MIITNVGTSSAAVFDFTIPRGDTGASGAGSGDVTGPASAVNNRVVFFDGATGKLIKDSGLTLSGNNTGDQDLSTYVTLTGAEVLSNKTLTAPIINAGTIGTSLVPTTNDGAALGSTTNQFSDLFLAEGGVINWDNSDATLTQVNNVITMAGADLRATTNGTNAASVVTVGGVQSLTNKVITERVITTTDDSTAVIDVTLTDVYELTAMANATTFSTTGTPIDGQKMIIRFKDNGTARALTWDAIFVAIGVTLPTTTVLGKWHYVGVQYNSNAVKFHVLAVVVQA